MNLAVRSNEQWYKNELLCENIFTYVKIFILEYVNISYSNSGGSPYPRMDGRKIANFLQEGYRMPKPQYLDDKLYVNMVLLSLVLVLLVCVFFLWLLSYNSICPLLFGLHVHLKIHHFYLLNQPNEGKWKEKYIIMSLWLWYITFLLWCKRDEICNQKSFFIKNRLNCF